MNLLFTTQHPIPLKVEMNNLLNDDLTTLFSIMVKDEVGRFKLLWINGYETDVNPNNLIM